MLLARLVHFAQEHASYDMVRELLRHSACASQDLTVRSCFCWEAN